jgi:hypothetical protein
VDKRGIKDGVHTPSHYEAQRLLGAIFNNNRKKQGRGNHPHADNMVKHHIHIQVVQKLECTEGSHRGQKPTHLVSRCL